MVYDDGLTNRRSIRLKGYDYSQGGYYFVTICTRNRECLLGQIKNGIMELNEIGKIIQGTWNNLPKHFLDIKLDEFVIMPNHVHGIIQIVGAQFIAPVKEIALINRMMPINPGAINRAPTLGEMIRRFKAGATYFIRKRTNTYFAWQRNYYEHVIRTEDEYHQIQKYIRENPINWENDENYSISVI